MGESFSQRKNISFRLVHTLTGRDKPEYLTYLKHPSVQQTLVLYTLRSETACHTKGTT